MPQEGHLRQLYHIFAYLKKYHNAEIIYNPSDLAIDESAFEEQDWSSSEFGHVQGKEELSPKQPEPHGLGFVMQAKVDASLATDTVAWRSRTGFLVYLNSSLVYWMSKTQTNVETSSFW